MSKKLCTAQLMGVKYDRSSVFNLQIIAHGEGHINSEFFRKALKLVQKRHFYLNAYISDSQTKEFIPFLNDVPIPFEIDEIRHLDDWREKAEQDLNQRFINGDEPFARVKVLKIDSEFKIIITLSHFISDGISITCLLKDILNVYSELVAGKEILHLEEIPHMSLTSDMVPTEIDMDYSIILSGDACNQVDKNFIPLGKRRTKIYEMEFSKDETRQLIDRCRRERTTVYAALCVSAMLALANQIRMKYKSLDDVNVSCVSVVDHRQLTRVPIKKEQLGLGALVARTYRTRFENNNALWNLARDGRISLRNFIMKHGFFKILKYIRQYLSLPDGIFQEKMEFRDAYVAISYLGNLENIGETERFGNMKTNKITLASTSQYLQGSEWGIFICAYIFRDYMTLSFNYIDGYWDEARTIQYACKVKETIRRMVS